jgi:hypothetical protein
MSRGVAIFERLEREFEEIDLSIERQNYLLASLKIQIAN